MSKQQRDAIDAAVRAPDSQLPGSPGLQALVGEQQGERLVSGAEEGRVRA